MKNARVVLCLLAVASSVALTQEKTNVQWKCDKPSDQHSLLVGDRPGHAYGIEHLNCTAIKGAIAGNKMKSSTGTEFLDIQGDNVTGHGEFVENMENGDRNLYRYDFSVITKNGGRRTGTLASPAQGTGTGVPTKSKFPISILSSNACGTSL